MSSASLDVRATQLRGQGVPFVRARVVLAEKPTSAKPGDEAIIHADGSIEGFVGGSCAESTVRAQSLLLLDSKQPLLLRITPTEQPPGSAADASDPSTRTVHNPCLSGGSLEIFLDPVVPAPLVQVHGDGPVAQALSRLADALDYRVSIGDQPAAGALAVISASHGRDEIAVLAKALDAGVPYIALVASRRRGAGVLAELTADRPDLASQLDRIHSPAGLDIGARTAAEIALSILAEVVALRSSTPAGWSSAAVAPVEAATAVDPVCGMTVAAVDSTLQLDIDGRRIYFCGAGCLRAYSAGPAGYPAS